MRGCLPSLAGSLSISLILSIAASVISIVIMSRHLTCPYSNTPALPTEVCGVFSLAVLSGRDAYLVTQHIHGKMTGLLLLDILGDLPEALQLRNHFFRAI